MAKSKFSAFVSPVGIAQYAWVDKPDSGFNGKEKPKFKIRTLIPDTEENRAWAGDVLATAQKEAKANDVKLKKKFGNPFNYPEDLDEDDFIPEEGKDKPKFGEEYRTSIWFDAKSDYKPGLIDSELKSLPANIKIMGGDEVATKFEVFPYEGLGSGVSLRLKVVQLVAKNGSFGGVNTDGFGVQEGGYVAPAPEGDEEDEDEF